MRYFVIVGFRCALLSTVLVGSVVPASRTEATGGRRAPLFWRVVVALLLALPLAAVLLGPLAGRADATAPDKGQLRGLRDKLRGPHSFELAPAPPNWQHLNHQQLHRPEPLQQPRHILQRGLAHERGVVPGGAQRVRKGRQRLLPCPRRPGEDQGHPRGLATARPPTRNTLATTDRSRTPRPTAARPNGVPRSPSPTASTRAVWRTRLRTR